VRWWIVRATSSIAQSQRIPPAWDSHVDIYDCSTDEDEAGRNREVISTQDQRTRECL
jgi:hypothetical protein